MSPRFLIVRDHKENKRKCTLSALVDHPRFEFVDLPHPDRGPSVVEIEGGILLSPDGPELTPHDRAVTATQRIVVIDSTWARVPRVVERLRLAEGSSLEPRSLPRSLVTAYPRTSKLYDDPKRGLASVEAVFAATVLLGEPDPSILTEYRWARAFLDLNVLTWTSSGWDPRRPRGASSSIS